LAQVRTAPETRNADRLARHVLSRLVCLGSHTITGLLSTSGRQFHDWSADYRLYGHNRVDPQALFEPVRDWLCRQNSSGPVVMAMDDTRVRKSGKKTHGVKYTRDPMGPPFHVNFIQAQRFLQMSTACAGPSGEARMIPIDWRHAPVPRKPKPSATAEEIARYQEHEKRCRISEVGVGRIAHLRTWLDKNGAEHRTLRTVVEGSFTNRTVLKHLPENTTLVGRIRSDAKLYHLPDQEPDGRGRRRVYGLPAPTPEQLRQDETHRWKTVDVFFGGEMRQVDVKQLGPLRWRAAGENLDLQLLVLRPIPYRTTATGKKLYRNPAYLICTDPEAELQEVIQHYLWRWDIEVNFRDEKTLLGGGKAQVRTQAAVENVTGTAVAAYAMLLLAGAMCRENNTNRLHLPAPKWQRRKPKRLTTTTLVQNLRYELWAQSIHFSGFNLKTLLNSKPEKIPTTPESALFYANRYS